MKSQHTTSSDPPPAPEERRSTPPADSADANSQSYTGTAVETEATVDTDADPPRVLSTNEPLQGKERRRTLSRLLRDLQERGATVGEVIAALSDVNAMCCRPPLPAETVWTIGTQGHGSLQRDPDVARLNQEHAVVADRGRTIVITERDDRLLGRRVRSRSSFQDIRNFYLNQVVLVDEENDKYMSLGKYWLEHPQRRQYRGIVFEPGAIVPGFHNLWKGFPVKPVPGDWSLMQEHIHSLICAGDDEIFFWLFAWMANLVQHPGQPGEVAIVMRGRQGTGKGVFARALGSLVGQHFVPVSQPRHLKGNFNAHLEDALIVFADEAFEPSDKEGLGVLKTLVTEPEIAIERKGRDVFFAPNRVHLLIASNEDLVVAAGLDERRFLVLDVSDAHAQDHAYFGALDDQMNSGGREAMLHELLTFPFIGEVNLRQAPATRALQEQKRLSMGPYEGWWFSKLEDGQLLPGHQGWQQDVQRDELKEDFAAQFGANARSPATQLGMFLGKVLPDGYPRKFQRNEGGYGVQPTKRWHWGFPTLDICRQHFDKLMRTENEWSTVTAQDDANED